MEMIRLYSAIQEREFTSFKKIELIDLNNQKPYIQLDNTYIFSEEGQFLILNKDLPDTQGHYGTPEDMIAYVTGLNLVLEVMPVMDKYLLNSLLENLPFYFDIKRKIQEN